MSSSDGFFSRLKQKLFPGKPVPDCILWLQEKQIPEKLYFSYETPQSRDRFWKYMTNPSEAPLDERDYFEDARTRLDVIFTAGDTATNEKPIDAHLFTEEEFPGYTQGTNILHFVHTPVCIQRYQKSRLCYLHAVAMVQYYAISLYCIRHNLEVKQNILDIASFIKDNFDKRSLEKHIFENDGGRSVLELERILHPKSKLKRIDTTDISGIVSCLSQYGPGLISNFKVYTDFETVSQHKHHGQIPPESIYEGKHAMVMVGYKYVDGKHTFLLQNWWLKKQFVEVDSEYLTACEPILHWITTEQPSIPDKMPTKTGSWLETVSAEFLDGYELEDC